MKLTTNEWLTGGQRKVYVASSWRNEHFDGVVEELRAMGHEVYDFKAPVEAFRWIDICPSGAATIETYLTAMKTQAALAGFRLDKDALDWCDTCVMVLPCGRSAHLEAGYVAGQGKHVIFWLHPDRFEPELMYLLGNGFVIGEDGYES